jgi:hypothetical protein
MLGGAYGGGGSAGGGGFGGGGLGGFFTGGGMGGVFPSGTAIGSFANVAANIGRVYPFVHWGIMLANELLATAGPAAIALGGAALVGTEGGQQLYNRYQAMAAVQESIGATSGQSIATFLGVPNTLQRLQTQYGSGEVYGLAGAGINALRTGGGNAFLQLGQNTLSMISGVAADFVLAMKGGLGQAAGAIVQGGTQYAQQFGDTLLNVGKTLMNVAPNLPGVGSMILTTLQATTGGLADVTKALGPGLLPLLGFEAGTRYGPTIVGGAAATLANILPFGLGGKLPTAAHAATAADVAAGAKNATTGALAAVGEPVAAEEGAGIAGILGALTAPEIGALAIGTIAVTRGLTGKTAAQQKYAGLATSMNLSNLTSNLGQIATEAFSGGALPPTQLGTLWSTLMRATPGGGRQSPAFGQAGSIFSGGFGQAEQGLYGVGVGARGAIADLFTGQWSGALSHLGDIWTSLIRPGGFIHGLGQMLGIVGPEPTAPQAALQQMSTAFHTWSGMIGAAGQVQDIWKGMGSGALSTASALDVLSQSGVNINTAFQKNGELTAKASQQVQNYVAGYQAMTGTVPGGATGGTLAAINAVGIAGGLSASKLATVNSAFDQMAQIASGGASGTAALTTLLAAVPAGGLAQGPLTAGGAAAFTAFSSTTAPSVISQLEQNMDWLRTAQQLGGFGTTAGPQASMAKFLLGQAFNAPGVAGSPLALAQLSPIAQEYGMAPLTPGESAKQYDAAFKSFLKGADSAKQYGAALTSTTEKIGNLPQDYQQFVTSASGGAQTALAGAIDTYGAGIQTAFMNAFAGGKGKPGAALESQYAGFLKAAGFTPAGAADTAGYAAKVAGATPAEIKGVIDYVAKYEKGTPPAQTATEKVTPQFQKGAAPVISGKVKYDNELTKPAMQTASGVVKYVNQFMAATAPTLHGTVVYSTVFAGGAGVPAIGSAVGGGGTRLLAQHGFRVPGYGGGDIHPAFLEGGEAVVPKHLVPHIAPFLAANKVPGFASGGLMVPAFTGVDTGTRAALEAVADELLSYIQGAIGSSSSGSSRYGMAQPYGGGLLPSGGGGTDAPKGTTASPVAVHIASVAPPAVAALGSSDRFPGAAGPMPAAANKVIDAFEKTFSSMPGPWSQVASQILSGLLAGVKNSTKETAAMAQTLVNKVTSEINFGRSVTNTAVSGFNFPGLQVAPPTTTAQGQPYQYYIDQQNIAAGGQPGSVQEQMGSYLQALKSFQGDMGKLAKGGLEKRLLSQLYAAGPIQGDAEAQSILGGQGGIKAANQLWNQINSVATKLGVSAIGNVYGQPGLTGKTVHAGATVTGAAAVHSLQSAINSLQGKTVTVKVKLDIEGGGGGTASGKPIPNDLSKVIMQQVQKAALQQAQRNRRTGLTLSGYGS